MNQSKQQYGSKAIYSVSALLGIAIFFISIGFDPRFFVSPIGVGDGLFGYAAYNGLDLFDLVNSQVAYPFGMDFRFFPSSEWASTLFINLFLGINVFLGYNLLYAISFPLVAVLSTIVLRKCEVRPSIAIAFGLAMTSIPYHWWRLEHQSLSLLLSVPIGIYLALVVNDGEYEDIFLNLIKNSKRSYINKENAHILFTLFGIPLLLSQLGLYFAFFSTALIALAALRRFAEARKVTSLLINLSPTIIIVFGLFLSLFPSFLVRDRTQHIIRQPIESIVYSGQLMDAVFPSGTSLFPGANFFAQQFLEVNTWANAVGSLGVRLTSNQGTIFTMLGAFFLAAWALGFVKLPSALNKNFSFLVIATVFFTITMIPYGLSTLFATVLSPQIRAWDRLVPFLQFLLIACLAVLLESIYRNRKQQRNVLKESSFVVSVLLVLVLDSVMPAKVAVETNKSIGVERFAEAKQISNSVSQIVGEDCAILQLPFIEFPESAPRNNLGVYEPLWLGLAGDKNNWSYGGIRGSKQGTWLERVSSSPGLYKSELMSYNFCGLIVDSRGYTVAELSELLLELELDFGQASKILDGKFYVFRINR